MPHVSSRIQSVAGSSTVRLAGIISEMKAKGQDVISFSVGEPDFPTPPHIVEAAKKALDEGFTKYTKSTGMEELREAIAEKSVKENDIPAKPENVLVSPTKHCIFIAVMSLVERGDEVIIPDPCWISYEPMVRLAGGKPVLVRTGEETGFELSPEAVAEAVTDKTKMILINSPSNPAGCVYSRKTMKGLADLAKDHDLYMVSDEIYEKILYEGKHCSPASFDGMFERTVTVNGFSKTYSMTGWRIGWLVADKPLLDQFTKVQEHTVTCAPPFVQKAAVAALRGPKGPVEAMVKEFRARRDLMSKSLRGLGAFDFQVPGGAFYIFPRYSLRIAADVLAERLLKEAGVALLPGTAFGPAGEGHLRFSYAASREDIERGLSNIEKTLGKMGKG